MTQTEEKQAGTSTEILSQLKPECAKHVGILLFVENGLFADLKCVAFKLENRDVLCYILVHVLMRSSQRTYGHVHRNLTQHASFFSSLKLCTLGSEKEMTLHEHTLWT